MLRRVNSYHLFVLSIVLGTIGGNMAFNIKIELSYFLILLFVIKARVIISGKGFKALFFGRLFSRSALKKFLLCML
jgi:hypothetical protein